MAEGILFETVSSLLEVLGSRLFQEVRMRHGLKVEIRKLKDTMETIQAVLLDAEEKYSQNNHQVKVWLQRLKAAVYDADDLLDDFATELKKRELMTGNKMVREVRIFFSKSNQVACSLEMTNKIKTIRKRLQAIQNDRQFHLDENLVRNIEREQTYSFVRAEEVVGREDEKNAIIQLLLDSNDVENISVIAIVGIGGVGKTALAQLIYNDEKVKNHFQVRIWACVSNDFNMETIVKGIIKSANDTDVERLEKLDLEQLQKRLRKELCGKKYLLILDDVWNENREKWLKLKALLISDMKGSKILVTTRSQQVARLTSTVPYHDLRKLNEDESWFLFTQMAFEHGIEPKGSNLIQIGKCIIAKCAGIPLGIRTIARLLYYNNMETYWSSFLEDELLKVNQEKSDILPTLELSYKYLPSHLKQCFAYCALFPKDYKIYKMHLIYLWMAQGFLQSSRINQRLEDVGNEYFMNLLSRSFFQDVEYDQLGNLLSCKMHDLMHDLATKIAIPECILAKLDATNVDEMARHISFDYNKLDSSWKIPASLLRANHVRTLLFLGDLCFCDDLNESNIINIVASFRCLRTLNWGKASIEKLSNSIGKLKHLRYLDLSSNRHIRELPNSISRLENLQILKLNNCRSLEKLPGDIRKVVSLRHLMIRNCDSLIGMPHGLRLLTNLQTLSMFVLGRKDTKTADLNELEGMNNFRGHLEIKRLENAKSTATLANLKAKQHLKSLKLSWANDDGVSIHDEAVLEGLQPNQNLKRLRLYRFGGLRICSWLSSLTNIISIYLNGCKQCIYIPPLDELPSLERLILIDLGALTYLSEKSSNDSSSGPSTSFFLSLKLIQIHRCRNLKGWWKSDDDSGDEATRQTAELPSFPCLSKLDIRSCPNLISMPLFPSLEELVLRDTGLMPLQQTMMLMNSVASSTSSTYSAPLFKLQLLEIGNCNKFYLLNNVDDNIWGNFTSLRSIYLFGISDLLCLPRGLKHVTTLQHLKIRNCPILTVLPKEMQFQVLDIDICPQIRERYGNSMSVEWPKICHIPDIRFTGHWIQNDGVYQIISTPFEHERL